MTFAEFRQARIAELIADVRTIGGDGAPGQNNVEGLIDLIVETKPVSVVEVGSNRGVSTEIFLLHCPHVVAVDSWEGHWEATLAEFSERVMAYPNLEVLRGESPHALLAFREDEFDLCYIDADHSYESVVRDINACKRIVKRGGWMAGHDCLPGSGVEAAVRELLGEPKIFRDTSWLIKKPD